LSHFSKHVVCPTLPIQTCIQLVRAKFAHSDWLIG